MLGEKKLRATCTLSVTWVARKPEGNGGGGLISQAASGISLFTAGEEKAQSTLVAYSLFAIRGNGIGKCANYQNEVQNEIKWDCVQSREI